MQVARGAHTPGSYYGAATEALESTAKWLVTAFAAVGALLIGSVQLTDIWELGLWEPRFITAIACLAIAITAVVYLIRKTSGIFMTEWVTLGHLSYEAYKRFAESDVKETGQARKDQRDLSAVLQEVEDAQEELYGHMARSIPDLHRHLHEANEEAAKIAANEVQLTWPDQGKVFEKVYELHSAARDVVECANYHRTRQQFDDLKGRLWLAVAIVTLCVLVFAAVTHLPPKSQLVKVEFASTTSAPAAPTTSAPAATRPR
jgi:hypothetical protein